MLDRPRALDAGDPQGALGTLVSLPEQVQGALAAADAAKLGSLVPDGLRSVVYCGMGGSGVGGDVLAAAAHDAGRVPVLTHKDYGIPAFCGPGTLVVAASYSGGTEETLDAFRAARDAGAPGVAVTSGGTLAAEAESAGWPVVRVGGGLMPRFAFGWMIAAPVATLERLGVIRLEAGWRDELVGVLTDGAARWGPQAPTRDNVAKVIAHELRDVFPVVWGSEGATGAAAIRWKNDLNENAKVFAHAAVLPELDHNEIVGWAAEGRDGRPSIRRVLICLREPRAAERVRARFEATVREVAGDFDLVRECTARGNTPVSTFFELALLGGFVSTYLAILRGIDPVPIPSIARLKEALQARGT